jgi:hypothetical protein
MEQKSKGLRNYVDINDDNNMNSTLDWKIYHMAYITLILF